MDIKKYDSITDADLLQRYYEDKNNEWLGLLLQRYTMLLLGVCMKYLKNEEEAKDGVQQVFLKTINELQKYKVDYFKSWIYMVAKNHCLMKLRNKGKYTTEINEQLLSTPFEETDKNEYIVKDNTLNAMAIALQQLNTEQQQCINLFYLQKKRYLMVFYFRTLTKRVKRAKVTPNPRRTISREKNPSDGRGVIIKLTDFGKEMREISKESVIIFNDIIKQHVTAEELEAFFKVTSTINKLITDKLIYKEDTINKAV